MDSTVPLFINPARQSLQSVAVGEGARATLFIRSLQILTLAALVPVVIVVVIVVMIVPPVPVLLLLLAVQFAKVAIVAVVFDDPLMVVDGFVIIPPVIVVVVRIVGAIASRSASGRRRPVRKRLRPATANSGIDIHWALSYLPSVACVRNLVAGDDCRVACGGVAVMQSALTRDLQVDALSLPARARWAYFRPGRAAGATHLSADLAPGARIRLLKRSDSMICSRCAGGMARRSRMAVRNFFRRSGGRP